MHLVKVEFISSFFSIFNPHFFTEKGQLLTTNEKRKEAAETFCNFQAEFIKQK